MIPAEIIAETRIVVNGTVTVAQITAQSNAHLAQVAAVQDARKAVTLRHTAPHIEKDRVVVRVALAVAGVSIENNDVSSPLRQQITWKPPGIRIIIMIWIMNIMVMMSQLWWPQSTLGVVDIN